jgi:arylsulfatase A-like enzyme
VELVDLYPTLAALCDVAAPDDLQGRSLVPMLDDPATGGKDAVYTVVTRRQELGKAIRTTRWRYTAWPRGEELYDLRDDPAEHRNLADSSQHSEILQVMRAHLRRVDATAVAAKR